MFCETRALDGDSAAQSKMCLHRHRGPVSLNNQQKLLTAVFSLEPFSFHVCAQKETGIHSKMRGTLMKRANNKLTQVDTVTVNTRRTQAFCLK